MSEESRKEKEQEQDVEEEKIRRSGGRSKAGIAGQLTLCNLLFFFPLSSLKISIVTSVGFGPFSCYMQRSVDVANVIWRC